MTVIDTALEQIAAARPGREKAKRREAAAGYVRKKRDLQYWMFMLPGNVSAIHGACSFPTDPYFVRKLCRALYHDIQTAKHLRQHHIPGGARRIACGLREEELRKLFTCECEQYRRQRMLRMAAE